jgi:hypothetical protein
LDVVSVTETLKCPMIGVKFNLPCEICLKEVFVS